ncbi:MAG: hypothetical protein VB023_05340 [Oscillibacter sp.]|nr:hypothetical protein [Oscillibacter sp.]
MKLSDRVPFGKKQKMKYPTKTTMNLAVRETNDNSPSRVVPVFAVLVLAVALFVKFGVMDRYAALNKAQASLAASESRLTEMNQLVTGYDRVASEYHRYSGDYLTDAQKQLVDRLNLLDLLQTRMAGVATLKSVSIVDNDMVVEISASSLKQVSDLRLALLQEAKVQSVTVYTATTGQTTSDGTVSASLVIHVAQEGTAGEASK